VALQHIRHMEKSLNMLIFGYEGEAVLEYSAKAHILSNIYVHIPFLFGLAEGVFTERR